MNVIFMGTPDFSVSILESLCKNFTVSAVFTQPDKPQGRKMIMTPPPVKVRALEYGIPVYQPETLKNEAILPLLKEYSPDVIVVAAYGKILPSYVLDFPKFGCVNVHASLLPEYRGAAPIQRAIMDGKKETGVTTMMVEKGLDTGDMLEKAVVEIGINDNFEKVHDSLAEKGAELIISTLKGIESGTIKPTKQNDDYSTYAQKIENADCIIDFSKDSLAVYNQIRALSPLPLAFCKFNGKTLKIVSSSLSDDSGTPGEVISLDGGKIRIACAKGSIEVTSLKPEGKNIMSSKDFINGRSVKIGDKAENTDTERK